VENREELTDCPDTFGVQKKAPAFHTFSAKTTNCEGLDGNLDGSPNISFFFVAPRQEDTKVQNIF